MNSKSRLYGAAGVTALAACVASPVLAAGTTQGTLVRNEVTIQYQVGGTSQTAAAAAEEFRVDRKLNLLVSELGGAATSVSPGQQNAVTTFSVTNSSNDLIDLGLAATNEGSGAGKFGTDNFDVTTLEIYRETNGTAGLQTGTGGDALVTYLDEVAADQIVTVYVVGDVPLGRATNDRSTVRLTATAKPGGAAGTEGATGGGGAAFTESSGANTAAVETVFADTDTGNGNSARDGRTSDRDDYTVLAAAITAAKTSRILSDPINGAASPTIFPKAIPDAVVEYCIAVTNAAGAAPATNVIVTDAVPATLTYNTGTLFVGTNCTGDVTSNRTDAPGDDGADYTGTTVTGTLPTVAAGETRTLRFKVTVK